MIKCPKCGKEYRDDAVFCTDCGIRLHEQYTAPNTDAGADSDQHTYTAPTGEAYHNSAPSAPGAPSDGRVLSMWDYFLMELVTKVPILRIVMYCVWGFSADTNENRKNWSRAQLIWAGCRHSIYRGRHCAGCPSCGHYHCYLQPYLRLYAFLSRQAFLHRK